MAEKRIRLRRDTTANWSSANPTLYSGEPGLDTSLMRLKMGDGSTAWNSLGWLKQDGVLFANTATPSAITSTSETDFTTGTTGYTIAASSVAVGDVFTIGLAGFYSGTVLPNITVKVYVGSTVVATTGSIAGRGPSRARCSARPGTCPPSRPAASGRHRRPTCTPSA